jgi:hypothetical protein
MSELPVQNFVQMSELPSLCAELKIDAELLLTLVHPLSSDSDAELCAGPVQTRCRTVRPRTQNRLHPARRAAPLCSVIGTEIQSKQESKTDEVLRYQ